MQLLSGWSLGISCCLRMGRITKVSPGFASAAQHHDGDAEAASVAPATRTWRGDNNLGCPATNSSTRTSTIAASGPSLPCRNYAADRSPRSMATNKQSARQQTSPPRPQPVPWPARRNLPAFLFHQVALAVDGLCGGDRSMCLAVQFIEFAAAFGIALDDLLVNTLQVFT